MFSEFLSKQYINYTTVLIEENENLLTFGVLGRVFHLEELDGEEDEAVIFYLLLSLLAGLATMLIILKIFRF